MSTQSLFALGATRVLNPAPTSYAHHRYDALKRSRAWRRARLRQLTDRWLRVSSARERRWEASTEGAR